MKNHSIQQRTSRCNRQRKIDWLTNNLSLIELPELGLCLDSKDLIFVGSKDDGYGDGEGDKVTKGTMGSCDGGKAPVDDMTSFLLLFPARMI